MPRAFHTAPASLTRTCAPRGRPQPGQPRSFVPRRRSLLFLTESKLGRSTALTYLRRGGRRRGAPRYSRFFGPAVTRHGPRIGGSAAASSTGSAQNFLLFRRATLGDQTGGNDHLWSGSSAGEQAQLRATLAAAGYSDSDLSYQQGQWRLGSASTNCDSAACGSTSRDTAAPARKIEKELRT